MTAIHAGICQAWVTYELIAGMCVDVSDSSVSLCSRVTLGSLGTFERVQVVLQLPPVSLQLPWFALLALIFPLGDPASVVTK